MNFMSLHSDSQLYLVFFYILKHHESGAYYTVLAILALRPLLIVLRHHCQFVRTLILLVKNFLAFIYIVLLVSVLCLLL